MSTSTAHKAAARWYAATYGTSFTEARRITSEVADPCGSGLVLVEELGVGALGRGATPAQRARAESVWRPVAVSQPCRCSGGCQHGQLTSPCCQAPMAHVDRVAAGLLAAPTRWADDYQCSVCERTCVWEVGATVPAVPWGQATDDRSVAVAYPGVRRAAAAAYLDEDEDHGYLGPDECEECGASPASYLCACG